MGPNSSRAKAKASNRAGRPCHIHVACLGDAGKEWLPFGCASSPSKKGRFLKQIGQTHLWKPRICSQCSFPNAYSHEDLGRPPLLGKPSCQLPLAHSLQIQQRVPHETCFSHTNAGYHWLPKHTSPERTEPNPNTTPTQPPSSSRRVPKPLS